MKVLIAEDDFTSRCMLSALLKKIGYEPMEVSNGLEAWEMLRNPDAPRLVLLDWVMPGMDGLEVLRRVRAQPTARPPYILMLTGKIEKAEIVAALNAGADDYLTKPFDPDEFQARMGVGRRMVELQEALVNSREELAKQASHDSLTGLLNRRAILSRLRIELERATRHSEVLSVGMCDIDHFKSINDTYGHQTGDDVLCEIARVLMRYSRIYDAVGRFGGEEFLIIAPIKAGERPNDYYQRLCMSISDTPMKTRSGELTVTISIGVALNTPEASMEGLLGTADAALYRAKAQGRNRVVSAA